MSPLNKTDIDQLKASGLFDDDWYRAAYPDVSTLRMDPAEHYLRYGRLLGRMSADGEQIDVSILRKLQELPAPKKGHTLMKANEVCLSGNDAMGLAYARKHLPAEFAYTIETLRANAALRLGDESGWLEHLTRYLSHFGPLALRLEGEGSVFERLTTKPVQPITDGPLISVIMPAWKAEATLRKAAGSILDQSWRNLELLIVDDASQDGTWGVMQELAARDPRVRIFRNRINVGPYVSKNIALTQAKGDWITGHDADDWAVPQRLERHIAAVLKAGKEALPASVTNMIRLFQTGELDRFKQIGKYSVDGLARIAPISCLFDAAFLRNKLGAWDNVRFGADSELMGRAEWLLGKEVGRVRQISMFCLSHENSLTNHQEYGVDRLSGPSEVRKRYAAAWMEWHEQLGPGDSAAARFDFPPALEAERAFAAPDEAQVPAAAIRRNHAALTGEDPALDQPVTAICSSKRPQFLHHIAEQLTQQTHRPLHVIYVAHGNGHDRAAIQRAFAGLTSITVLDLPDPAAFLGDALNLALDECQTDLVTKIDDDDFYGPNYIRGALAAFLYNGYDGVGVVGRGQAYCYVEKGDIFALRFADRYRNAIRPGVFGGTIFWSRAALADQQFQSLPRAVDTAFLGDAASKGVKVYSGEPDDYIHLRYSDLTSHTWKVEAEAFMKPAREIAKGLRLDLAYSSPISPRPALIPGQRPPSDKLVESPRFTALLQAQRERVREDRLTNRVTSALFSKARMKAVVQNLVPMLRIPRILASFARIEDFVTPDEASVFVLKPNGGSYSRGIFLLQKTKTPGVLRDMVSDRLLDREALIKAYRIWQENKRTPITAGCFVEELVTPRAGQCVPDDFKFFCFAGQVGLIQQRAIDPVDPSVMRFRFWSPDWQDLGPIKFPNKIDSTLPVPPNAADAVRLAKMLSAQIPVPFCRIDLYINEGGVFFGETTPFPNGGKEYFDDTTDARLAELWARAELHLSGIDAESFLRATSLQQSDVKGQKDA